VNFRNVHPDLKGGTLRAKLIVTVRVETSNGDVLEIVIEIPIIPSPARPVRP